jgi:hypothetical protein
MDPWRAVDVQNVAMEAQNVALEDLSTSVQKFHHVEEVKSWIRIRLEVKS